MALLKTTTKTLLYIVFSIFFKSFHASITYNVVDFGADPNGQKDSTDAFHSAWSKVCTSLGSATLLVPQGTFLLQMTKFEGPCQSKTISIEISGSLVAPTDYTMLGSDNPWIQINGVDGISISGGTIDGKGKNLWDCKNSEQNCPKGSTSLGISNSNNIKISSLTLADSQMFHMKIVSCQNVVLEEIKALAPEDSPNTDGIHIQESSFVSIYRSTMSTGDDCVSIGPGSSNLWIEDITCGPGHGISIGSLGNNVEDGGVQNVTVTMASFSGTKNGFRIKTWGKPSHAIVKHVTFQHATINNVHNPIIIDQNYCPDKSKGCINQPSGVQINGITFSDIHGSSATKDAIKFECSSMKPCYGLILENINLNYDGEPAETLCANAFGKTLGIVNPPGCLKS